MGLIGSLVTDAIRKNSSGRVLQRRSGRLEESWIWKVQAIKAGWELAISSDAPYARIHEWGGFTGRNHTTKIKKTRYVTRAVLEQKARIRRILRDYVARLFVR